MLYIYGIYATKYMNADNKMVGWIGFWLEYVRS